MRGGLGSRERCRSEKWGAGGRTAGKGRALAGSRGGEEQGGIRLAVSAEGLPEAEDLVEAGAARDAARAVKTANC